MVQGFIAFCTQRNNRYIEKLSLILKLYNRINYIKSHNFFIIKSYFLSNFLIRNSKNIIKLNEIKIGYFKKYNKNKLCY